MQNTMFEKSEEQNGSLSVSDLDFEKFSGPACHTVAQSCFVRKLQTEPRGK